MNNNLETKAEWTVMVYMAADNNLEAEAIKDLEVIKSIGSTSKMNVVAQFDSRANKGAWRYYLRKGTLIHEDTVETLRETNTGHPDTLSDFINWATTKYKSEKTLLVLWGHGFGWKSNDRENPVIGSPIIGFLYDDNIGKPSKKSEDVLRMDEFRKALKNGIKGKNSKIDVLGMDACLMGMVEVGYQVRDYVDYMVASEDPIPNDGWPYCRILKRVAEQPEMTPEQLARIINREFLRKYLDQGKDTVYSVMKLGNLDSMVISLSELVEELIRKMNNEGSGTRAEVFAARAKTQSYFVDDYVDLHHFCWNLSRFSNDENIKRLSKAVMNNILYIKAEASSSDLQKDSHTINNSTTEFGFVGYRLRNSKGISIYFPCTPPLEGYDSSLQFVKYSKWDEFLKKLTEVFSKSELKAEVDGATYTPYLGAGGINLLKICEGTVERDCIGGHVRIPADPLI